MPLKDKEARKEYQRVYHARKWQENLEENRLKAAERIRQRRKEDPEKAREDVRKWRRNNPEKAAECNRKWHREHPEVKTKWTKNNPFKAWAMFSNSDHKKNGIKIEISTVELAKIAEKTPSCLYCGLVLDYSPFKGKPKENSPQADRVNNGRFINKFNVQIICRSCNRRKRDKPHFEFMKIIQKKENQYA